MKLRNLTIGACMMLMPFASSAYTNLTVNDPHSWGFNKVGTIESAVLTVDPQKDYVFYELEMELSAGIVKVDEAEGHDTVEISCNFELPAGAFVKSASLLIEGEWVEAELMPRKEAHAIYEGVVQRRRDPLIIYKNSGNQYLFKIYPLALTDSRTMKIRYATPMSVYNENKSIALPIDILEASNADVDLKVLLKETELFATPDFSDESVEFVDSETEGYLEAVVTAEAIDNDVVVTSSTKKENANFSSTTEDGETTYRFSFIPDELFDLDDSKKYLLIIDNDPEPIKDTIWDYVGWDSENRQSLYEFERENGEVLSLNNDVLLKEVKSFLKKLDDDDQFNIILKNKNIYTYASDWKNATDEEINAAITAVGDNDDKYMSDINALLKASMEWANQEQVTPIFISNNKEYYSKMMYTVAQKKAQEAIEGVEFKNRLYTFDITSVDEANGQRKYVYNQFLGYVSNGLGAIKYRIRVLDNISAYQQNVDNTERAEILLLNVVSGTDKGMVYDVADNASGVRHSNTEFVQFGKVKDATTFEAGISFRFKGEVYTKRLEFAIEDMNDPNIADAWAVALIDKLGANYTDQSRRAAEEMAGQYDVLSRYSALLSLEPGMEITKCENCPDWGDWDWRGPWGPMLMTDGLMLETANFSMDMAVEPALAVEPVATKEDGSYNDGYQKGLREGEEDCQLTSDEAYDAGYKAGLAANTTSIEAEDEIINVYPSPFEESFTVELEEGKEYVVTISDVTGVLIYKTKCSGTIVINEDGKELPDLTSGVYIIQIDVDGETYQKTIVKK